MVLYSGKLNLKDAFKRASEEKEFNEEEKKVLQLIAKELDEEKELQTTYEYHGAVYALKNKPEVKFFVRQDSGGTNISRRY